MKVLKRTVPLWALLLVAALAFCTITYAALVAYRELSSTITIVATYDMEIYDTDKTTILTHVDFGTLTRGQAVTQPNGGERFNIKNIGDDNIWITFETAGFPADVTLKVSYSDPNTQLNVLPGEMTSFSIAPGEFQEFYFYVQVSEAAAFDTYNPTITFNAFNSATG